MSKITWKKVFEDFKERWPSLRRKVIHWQPYNYATIIIYFAEGERSLYNYDTKCLIPVEKEEL